MGQYYRFYLDNGKEQRVLCPFDYDNTFKLMEHSWVGNGYCNAVVKTLQDMGECRVYHVGDYAEDLVSEEIYDACWGENEHLYKDAEIPAREGQVFIVCEERSEYIRYCFGAPEGKWYVNTFALLTALGNQRGGGDYYGSNEDMVGLWAGQTLLVTEEEPVGLEKIHGWTFREGGRMI